MLIGAAIHFAFGPSTSLRIHRAPVNRAAEAHAEASSTANASPSSTDGTGLSARRNDGTSTGTSTSVVGTSGSPTDPAATHPVDVTVPTSLHLDVKPSGSCWLSATADGQRVLYRLMNAGERTQKRRIVLLPIEAPGRDHPRQVSPDIRRKVQGCGERGTRPQEQRESSGNHCNQLKVTMTVGQAAFV